MWLRRSDDGWRINPPFEFRSCGVHLRWPLLRRLSSRAMKRRPSLCREGFLVAMMGTIRHEAARRSLLFDRCLQAPEPAGPPRII